VDHFKNKYAVVTGGASGIGRALCEALGKRGTLVIVADVNAEGAEDVASVIRSSGGRAKAKPLDVSQGDKVQSLLEEVFSEHKQIDYMFNNAGIAVGAEMYDIDFELWRKIIDINLMGVVHGTKAAYWIMMRQGFGHIVNISSLSGLIGHPTAIPYAATKSSVIGLSTSLRAEAVESGVKVSVACPGFVQTGIFDAATMINARREDVISNIPFKMMDAEQAAEKILRGVERNRAIIVFPFYARFLWWLYRLHPGLIAPVARKMVQDFRRARSS
jgi:short-subunit dehydrogenase